MMRYYTRNPKRSIPIVLVIALGILAVLVLTTIVESTRSSVYASLDMLKTVVTVKPKQSRELPAAVIESIRSHPDVEAAYNYSPLVTNVNLVAGATPFNLFALAPPALTSLMDHYQARLIEGRLPQPGTAEIVLPAAVLRAKGLKVGSETGSEVDPLDALRGRYTIVGALEGPVRVGFASLEYVQGGNVFPPVPTGLVVVPKPNRIDKVEELIASSIDGKEAELTTYAGVAREIDQLLAGMNGLLALITAIMSCIIAVTVTLTNYIFFLQRTPEFAILMTMGYTQRSLLWQIVREHALLLSTCWATGFGIATLVTHLLRIQVFTPKGLILPGFSLQAIQLSLFLPAIVGLTATIALIVGLRRMDPVAVIERRG